VTSLRPASPEDRLIVALDVESLAAAERLLDRLDSTVRQFKVGSQLFAAAGPAAVQAVRKRGAEVFLDLKFHDIPNTVAAAAREAVRMGVMMFNVHASGGSAMMKAAVEATQDAAGQLKQRRPLVIAVTVLTSLDRLVLQRELGVASAVEGHVLHLCRLARAAGLDGVVVSPQEARAVRTQVGPDWVVVTPGVRPMDGDAGDQQRIATPAAAVRAGARYLVVGRPVIAAPDPAEAARAILREMMS
jgi:orotidine-5'-phosphate decarboxylase